MTNDQTNLKLKFSNDQNMNRYVLIILSFLHSCLFGHWCLVIGHS
jgi:hypothetical protein